MNLEMQTGSCRTILICHVAFSHGIFETKKNKNHATDYRQYVTVFFHRITFGSES
jgi:hypothetical protein